MLCFIDFQFNCGTIDTLRVVEPWAWVRVVEQLMGEKAVVVEQTGGDVVVEPW